MEIKTFEKMDIEKAAELLASRHKKERLVFSFLNRAFENKENTVKLILKTYEKPNFIGVCAYENEEFLGFILSEIRTEGSFGRCAYVKYDGMAISEKADNEVYRMLYSGISEVWIKNRVYSHYVEVPAAYEQVMDSWLKLSFAYQQVYAVAKIEKCQVELPVNIKIAEAEEKDSKDLQKLSDLICTYQMKSPTYAYMSPLNMKKIKEGYGNLPKDKDAVVLLAHNDKKLVGFQCAYKDEDNSNMMKPEKAFEIAVSGVITESRGKRIGTALTRTMKNKGIAMGFENAIADWRIANLSSSNFWAKEGFKPIAYRMYREIDERICL